MKKLLMLVLMLGLFVSGCATTAKNAQTTSPQKVMSGDDGFTIWAYADRHYVTASEKMNKMFAEHNHLPYTKTILGAGPHGETVVFEVDKKDPAFVEGLIDQYNKIPFLLESRGDNYSVYKYNGRIYVIGNPQTRDFFVQHQHLPYTKTVLGAGPNAETVIFEADKKDPEFAENLIGIFKG
ncbi:hypothetical protein [uncultured Desulfuromusa sp.]|uniref:hypothetical protein n=1 Tax=uncultured Desulfuromusa sp. TaxID=219183 RepID=UPI002AA7F152|nr:hypothetical protein [uncultured Desulfuromusa sp.]